jgi:hypothetical protein
MIELTAQAFGGLTDDSFKEGDEMKDPQGEGSMSV